MGKLIKRLAMIILLVAVVAGCSKPPYDARGIDSSEVDQPSSGGSKPAGGGKALKDSQW